jgi:hypothetical protein
VNFGPAKPSNDYHTQVRSSPPFTLAAHPTIMADVWSDIAAVVTATGVAAAVVELLLSRRQARSVFEHEFVQRYWVINDDTLKGDAADSDLNRRRYLRLCEGRIRGDASRADLLAYVGGLARRNP